MKQINEIKLNKAGQVDVDFYIDQAHTMRAAYMAEMFAEFKVWFVKHLHLNDVKYSFARMIHH